MFKTIFIALSFLVTLTLEASVDPFNTYQWNRKNEISGNGKVDKSLWYEWWYYKVVIPETGKSFFFVYGVVNPWDFNREFKGTRSYVGMGDFSKKLLAEEKFDINEFKASYKETYVSVERNVATDKFFNGNIQSERGEAFQWNIQINKKWSYNAEGGLLGKMFTDIEWYPAQASATCTGSIISAGETVHFKDAPCYQDRNWGKQFPDWWTWIVSNHFEGHPETALAIGGGKPHVRGRRTPLASVSIGLKHEGKEYAFSPVHLTLVKTDVSFGKWKVMAIGHKYKIEVEAFAPKEDFMDLQFMTPTGEIFHDYETLTGKVTVKLYERKRGIFKLKADLVSNYAGIEFGSTQVYQNHILKNTKAFRDEIILFEK